MSVTSTLSSPSPSSPEPVDILLLTAIHEEYTAVLQVEAGAWPESRWEERPGPHGYTVAFRDFQAASGGRLRVAVTWATQMGQVATTALGSMLVDAYNPRCLAMCGVCAGRKGKVELGDVIIADLLWQYDFGKREVEYTPQEQRVEHFWGRQLSYSLDGPWKQRADDFQPPRDSEWLRNRPRTYEAQEDWVLACLSEGKDPREYPECKQQCKNFAEVLMRLREKEYITGDIPPELTDSGRKYIRAKLYVHPNGLPESQFKVRVGPIATGSSVIKDKKIFEELAKRDYQVLGLEMEAAAIGALVGLRKLDFMVVMKGVMDFADLEKNDHFKEFAARASAECLLAFLRENVPPVEPDGFEDLLESGVDKPPEELSPSALLNGRYQFVKFSRREQELSDLHAWCEGSEPVRARLYYGDGGMGKSRLLAEFCARLDRRQWVAGFLVKSHEAARFNALVAGERDALLVIDYAESREHLSELLKQVALQRNTGRRGRLRVVLLSRVAGEWFDHLRSGDTGIQALLAGQTISMAPLAKGEQAKQAAFREAVECFAEALGRPGPSALPVLDLGHERFERVLFIHMVALAAVEGWELSEDLVEDVLKHEERFWRTLMLPRGESAAGARQLLKRIRRAAAAMTLVGGATEQEARALLEGVNGVSDDALLDLLSRVYPGKGKAYVSGVEPDLLGEALVLHTVREEGDEGKELLRRLMAVATPGGIQNAQAVMGRTKTRELGEKLLEAARQTNDVELARRVYAAGLPEYNVNLIEYALWVTATVLANLPPGEGDEYQAQRASLLLSLGKRQSEAGQREEALERTQEAVALRRELAARQPDAFRPDLALSLNNLGLMQSSVGKREEALASTQEAVAVYRELAARQPDAFRPDLALSLNNLGARQSEVGKREEALASTQEAVAVYRELAARQPDAFRPYLAGSLNNLGIWQSSVGKRGEALESTQEAVAVYRELAARQPDAFRPDLAMSLNNLGARQSEVGKREEALESTQEAVAVYRELAARQPDAFRPDLAGSLTNLGIWQSKVGKREEALASTQEAVAVYRELAARQPDAFRPDLAMSLNNLGKMQSEVGKREEALASTQEAVALRRELAARQPDAFRPDLAGSLNNLGARQSEVGKREEALASTQEAVAVYRELAARQPDAFLPYLAMSLNNLGQMQSEVGKREEALESTQEAVAVYRELAAHQPDAFRPDLALSLNNLGARQSEVGKREEALASTQEALEFYWPFFEKWPQAFSEQVGIVLRNMLDHLKALGRPPSQQLLERLRIHAERLPRASQDTGLRAPKPSASEWKAFESAWPGLVGLGLLAAAIALLARC